MWRMTISGIPEFISYCLKYPGRSLYELACQGSELIVGLGKIYCDEQGTGKYDMPKLMGDFFDLSGICRVLHNEIDIGKILQRLMIEKKHIFNDKDTIKIEQELESTSPPIFKWVIDMCEREWEPPSEPPSFIKAVYSRVKLSPNAWKTEEIKEIVRQSFGKKILNQSLNVNSPEYQETLKFVQNFQTNDNFNNLLQFEKAKMTYVIERKNK